MRKIVIACCLLLLFVSCATNKRGVRYKYQDSPICKYCGTKTVEIVYGYPSERGAKLAGQKIIVLGGCMPMPGKWACPNCHAKYYSDGEPVDYTRWPYNIKQPADSVQNE